MADPLAYGSEIDFGSVDLTDAEQRFYDAFNHEIILLCRSLPVSAQTDALLFFARHSGTAIGATPDFFRNCYAPAWSILFWLVHRTPGSSRPQRPAVKNAITVHAMAIFLHYLDDHVNDGETPATHLVLLLRSQAWRRMNRAMDRLAAQVPGGDEIAAGFIDEYYSAIRDARADLSLDGYCERFKGQMATGFIAPVLVALSIDGQGGPLAGAVRSLTEAFGVAWRLLDDIRDMGADVMNGSHSAVYVCLPESARGFWDSHAGMMPDLANDCTRAVVDGLLENRVIDRLLERSVGELAAAASIADRHRMNRLADEFRCLMRPIQDRKPARSADGAGGRVEA